jgi:hypothetical protein
MWTCNSYPPSARWRTSTASSKSRVRKDARELVLADHHLHVDAEVAGVAEHFDDAAVWRPGRRGPAGDFDVDDDAFEIVPGKLLRARFGAEHAMWRFILVAGSDFRSFGNEDGLRHPIIKGDDVIDGFASRGCVFRPLRGEPVLRRAVVERPDHSGVAAFDDAGDAAEAAAVGAGRSEFHQYLVALHGAVDLAGRDKDIVLTTGLASKGTHKAVAVAVQVEAAGEEVVARAGCGGARDAPHFPIELDEFAASGEAGQLFEQQAPLAPAAQAEFPDQLLEPGFGAGGAGDARDQFAIGHESRVA